MSQDLQNILAIDTATRYLKLALSFGRDRQVKSDNLVERSHGQVLLKKIDELFQSAGLKRDALEAIVVCLGPGSFTGLRVGLSGAKGMAAALEIPVKGVNLFDLAAYKLQALTGPVHLLLPHRQAEYFVASAKNGVCDLSGINTLTAEELSRFVTGKQVRIVGMEMGDLLLDPEAATTVQVLEYEASDLLYLGRQRLAAEGADDLASLEPMYVQNSQAEIRFEKRREEAGRGPAAAEDGAD